MVGKITAKKDNEQVSTGIPLISFWKGTALSPDSAEKIYLHHDKEATGKKKKKHRKSGHQENRYGKMSRADSGKVLKKTKALQK